MIIFSMFKNSKLVISFISIFLFSGCSFFTSHGRAFNRAEKAEERGDYYRSVLECVESLKLNRDYEKPLLLMDNVFPKAIMSYNQKLNRYLKKENKNWDMIIKFYQEINYMIDSVEKLNILKQEIWFNSSDLRDYELELKETKESAASFYYEKALNLMAKDKQEAYKKSAQSFKKSQTYISDYKDSTELYDICRQKAIKRIAIMAFENKSGNNEFGAIGEEVSDAIISKMLRDSDLMEYIEIVSRDQIDQIINEQKLSQSGIVEYEQTVDLGKILGVQEMITGKVSRMQVSNIDEVTKSETFKKRVTVDYEYYTDDNGKQKKRAIKGDVRAKAKIYKITRTANMSVSSTLLDVESAKILYSNSIKEEYKFEYEWATYTGDKRALSYQLKSLIRKDAETAPSKGSMITELSNKISKKLKRELTAKLD
jgi:TolB-like protein